ncbi:pyruvate dehydrogenase [Flexivirga endophytica]|uniref:Pyruvate dehydrogenase n=2 Tax=Flexivirga endophytica TaxID=1849103 RepID=A0A916SSX8_9MICO|nr:pyruvate dehydrogenase [Flexivirga endophytica]GHB40091.1 pyruvate dehydrogenase [Flexivirga endophytica]
MGAMATIADSIIRTLKASGVRRLYGVPGDSLNGLTDALRRDGDLQWAHVRNEEVGAFAAGAEAQLTGELAVCVGSCGPGNVHLINGLYDAGRSHAPVLAIAAQIPREEIGSGYFQETHPTQIFNECSVYAELVSCAEQFPVVFQQALQAAISRRGVAVIVVPGEIFMEEWSAPDVLPVRTRESVVLPPAQDLEAAAEIIGKSKRPAILAGAGCAGAHDELVAFADAIKAPVVHSLRGKEWIEWDNPYDVGLTGLIGYDSGYRAMEHCDVLIMAGTDFPYRPFLPDDVPVIQIDVRGERIGRRVQVSNPLVGTVRDTLPQLQSRIKGEHDSSFADTIVKHHRKRRAKLDELAEPGKPRETPLHPQFVTDVIDKAATDDAVFTCDVGTPTVWAARYVRMNGKRRLLGSFNHGSMANALAQAIGASAAYPQRQVVALAGDGGLAMLLGDLITLRQLNLPVKVMVYNNSALSFVELEMKQAGLINFGTGLDNPDFAAIADAIGIRGFRAERTKDVQDCVQDAFKHDGPALVDLRVARQELSLPPKITLSQVKGFTLYATRTVLSGRGSEIVELARTNLQQL